MNALQDEHTGAHGMPGGLAISAAGYTLRANPTVFEPGRQEKFSVRVLDEAGREVRNLDEQHGQRMHLIVVRRDLMYYQHLHPSLNENGSWTVSFALPEPGVYRAFADFTVDGMPLTLGVDLTAQGDFLFVPLPSPTNSAHTEGGYEVALDAGTLEAGAETALHFRVSREGQDVEGLEPYLGAMGHLVALREGDLAYLHVHPTGGSGSRIDFRAVFPSIGRYRLFLQFAHEGQVRTAAFTVEPEIELELV
jgi:hypothetical protein